MSCVVANGCDFDEFAGLEHTPSDRLRILHAGFFFGVRSPRPFLQALAACGQQRQPHDVVAEQCLVDEFQRQHAPRQIGDRGRARTPERRDR